GRAAPIHLAGLVIRFLFYPTQMGTLSPDFGDSCIKRGRRDSNPQPPDRQSQHVALQGEETERLPVEEGPRLLTGCTDPVKFPADLARIIDLWPNLPENVRRAILALAGGCE